MKKSDIAMIVLIASLSVTMAFLVANSLPFFKPNTEDLTVPTIEVIPAGGISEEIQPDPKVFNEKAINPTVKTIIGKDG